MQHNVPCSVWGRLGDLDGAKLVPVGGSSALGKELLCKGHKAPEDEWTFFVEPVVGVLGVADVIDRGHVSVSDHMCQIGMLCQQKGQCSVIADQAV